jgi:hypothetical protein
LVGEGRVIRLCSLITYHLSPIIYPSHRNHPATNRQRYQTAAVAEKSKYQEKLDAYKGGPLNKLLRYMYSGCVGWLGSPAPPFG